MPASFDGGRGHLPGSREVRPRRPMVYDLASWPELAPEGGVYFSLRNDSPHWLTPSKSPFPVMTYRLPWASAAAPCPAIHTPAPSPAVSASIALTVLLATSKAKQ